MSELSKSFLVGGLGQGIELLTLGHVLNRIATAQQAQLPNASFLRTVRDLYTAGGVGEFYKGLRWNLVSSCCKAGTRWTLTSTLYGAVGAMPPDGVRARWWWSDAVAVAVMAAAVETTFVLTPLESLRTLEMTTALPQHKAEVGDAVRRRGLLRTLTTGWDRVFVRQLTSWVSYLVAYDQVKALIIPPAPARLPFGGVGGVGGGADGAGAGGVGAARPPPTLLQKAAVGVGTGTVACLFTTPLDMLRTQTQMAGASTSVQGRSMFGAARHVLAQHSSLSAFYGSFVARLLRSSWYSCVTLLCMDYFDALPAHMKM